MNYRNIIIHCHIFKNAGSTFDDSLLSNFEKDFIDHREDNLVRSNENFFKKYLEENKNIQAFSSHSVYHTPNSFENIKLYPIYFLRHPIERIKSVYSFEKKQPFEISEGAKKAKELNFIEYIRWRMTEKSSATIRNLQTRFLSGIGYNNQKSIEEKFNIALKKIETLPLIGVVDRYDETMVVFEEYLKKYFPKIDLSYVRRNVTDTDLKSSVENKALKILSQLPKDLAKEVIEKNKYDQELYNKANHLLNEKIEKINNFNKKLQNFKTRCLVKQTNILLKQKKYLEVEKICQKELALGVDNISIYLNLATSLKELKKYDKAIKVYDQAIIDIPNNPWSYFLQAELYSNLDKKSFALENYKKYKDSCSNNIVITEKFKKLLGLDNE